MRRKTTRPFPPRFAIPQAEPHYYGFSMPLQAFIVNTDLLEESEYPRTWEDLIDPRYEGELVMANPALSGSAYAQIFMMNGTVRL